MTLLPLSVLRQELDKLVDFSLAIVDVGASAEPPATHGDAIDVPPLVSPTDVTASPFAVISGSSRSPCAEAGLRNTDPTTIEEASSV